MSSYEPSFEELLKKLQQSNDELSRTIAASSSTSNPQIPQQYHHRIENKPDPLPKFYEEYMRQEIVIKENPRYADIIPLPSDRPPVKYDFLDTELIGKPGIVLERYADESIVAIGRVGIPMLSSGFSGQGAAAIFTLAYHLKAPRSRFREFIFNLDERLQVITDKPYSDFHDKVNPANTNHEEITAFCDLTREAAVYSYIAASLFRLFTKPASNYVNAWSQILNGFSRFYEEPMRVKLPVPTIAAVEHLKNWFSMDARAKVTLYRFLYMSNSNESHKGLKKFLYDNHLLNNGMQIVSIIEQLSDVLNCSAESIVTAIKSQEMEKPVKCLVHILKLQTQNDENHQKKMWRYGRVFDEAFMSDLQTKSCPRLVYILAEALRSEEPEKHRGILQIAQLADVSENNKRWCAIVAQRLLTLLKSQNPQSI